MLFNILLRRNVDLFYFYEMVMLLGIICINVWLLLIIKILYDLGFSKGASFIPLSFQDAPEEEEDSEVMDLHAETNDKALEIDLRDKEFSDRIARMKLELSKSDIRHKRSGVIADIGEEGIYNLPHDDVDVYPSNNIDDLEVSQ